MTRRKRTDIAACDVIETQAAELAEFLERVLDLKVEQWVVTDESRLRDFIYSGHVHWEEGEPFDEYCERWDMIVRDRIREAYGYELDNCDIELTVLLAELERHRVARDKPH